MIPIVTQSTFGLVFEPLGLPLRRAFFGAGKKPLMSMEMLLESTDVGRWMYDRTRQSMVRCQSDPACS